MSNEYYLYTWDVEAGSDHGLPLVSELYKASSG